MVLVCQGILVCQALFQQLYGRINLAAVGKVQGSAAALLCSFHSLFKNGLCAFAGTGNQRHDRHAELGGKLLHVDMKAGLAGFVHHVAGKHDRHAHFHHLHCQNQVALKG